MQQHIVSAPEMNAITVPPAKTPKPLEFDTDSKFLRLAREIAMDIHPLEHILKRMDIGEGEWELIRSNGRFQMFLRSAVETWNSATSTAERVKIKSLAFIEESLPEFFARAHDPKETLNSKVEVLKTVSKFAGVGGSEGGGGSGEKFSVTINLGGETINIEKQLPARVIDHQPSLNSDLG